MKHLNQSAESEMQTQGRQLVLLFRWYVYSELSFIVSCFKPSDYNRKRLFNGIVFVS